ncbi:hypothetical protein Tco_0243385 [Tanacetum coccineum]
MTPRSCLRWKPTGRVFKNVVLRWVPTRKTFASSTTKVDSEPPNGSNADITNQCESEQALDVSADISENRASRNFDLMIIKWRLLKITLQAPFLNVQKTTPKFTTTAMNIRVKAGSKSCSLSKQDNYITTRVGITIPPSNSNAEDNSPAPV